ncbi:MAG: amidohydrolase family protein [Actinomycetota bacterium]
MSATLIRAGWVLTMGPAGDIEDGAVLVDGSTITGVGRYPELRRSHPQATVVGDRRGILTPGFVNTHGHMSEALIPGMGSELTLYEWGNRIVGPVGEHLTAEMAEEGTVLKSIEMIRSGVTTVNDMFVHSSPGSLASLGVVAGLERSGLRGVVSFGAENALDGPTDMRALTVEEILEEHDGLAAAAERTERVTFRYGIGTLLGQSDDLLEAGLDLCRQRGWGVHTHLAEVREELVSASLRWGRRTIDHAEEIGLLEVPLLAGHAIWVTERDIELLSHRGVGVAHNPVANMILASGVCPVSRLRHSGIPVGIGTDGAASNDSQNMLEAVKMAALLQKVHHTDPAVISATDALEMATRGGARALGLEDRVGSLEEGKEADLALFGGTVELAAIHDPYQQLVYCTSPRSVSDVWIAGNRVLSGGELADLDEGGQVERCRPLAAKLAAASGLAARGVSWLSTT